VKLKLQPISEWQRDNKDQSAKNADFATLIGRHEGLQNDIPG